MDETTQPVPTREEALRWLNNEQSFSQWVTAAGLPTPFTDDPMSAYFVVNDMTERATDGAHARVFGTLGILNWCRDRLAADEEPPQSLLDEIDALRKQIAIKQ